MAMSWKASGQALSRDDLEYLDKIDWLWDRLSSEQKSKVGSSIETDTLRQENSRQCLIGQATGIGSQNSLPHETLRGMLVGFANTVFYNGPTYDCLIGRRVTRDEKKILDDIYYARIGNSQHQYGRANELIRMHISDRVAAA